LRVLAGKSDREELVGHLGTNAPNYFMYQWVGGMIAPCG